MMKTRYVLTLTFFVLGVFGLLGLAVFIKVGIYEIAANQPHIEIERQVILAVKKNAINYWSMDTKVVPFSDGQLVKRGVDLYVKNCEGCHGGPGVARAKFAIGLNPNPPPLVNAAKTWSPKELVWIISSGLKMAGMPGFSESHSEQDILAMAAFVERLRTLDVNAYKQMRAFVKGENGETGIEWLPGEQGWGQLAGANPKHGKELLMQFGCKNCHSIPGVPGASGKSGPPLDGWRSRQYIAGSKINNPINLVRWLMNPSELDDDTSMPNLGVERKQALDMAAYLYELR